MALRLGFDVDGVLADFRSAFQIAARGVAHLESGVHPERGEDEALTGRDVRRVWAKVHRSPNWWTALDAYEPAQIARLYGLARRLRWEVVFMTRRPESAGDTVQFQTQWWLEHHGFYLPSVVTVPGLRGDLAGALRLDLIVDDQLHNCIDIVSGSTAKAILLLRDRDDQVSERAIGRGIGVVSTLEEALDVLERADAVIAGRRGRLNRLIDWFHTAGNAPAPLRPGDPRPEPAGE